MRHHVCGETGACKFCMWLRVQVFCRDCMNSHKLSLFSLNCQWKQRRDVGHASVFALPTLKTWCFEREWSVTDKQVLHYKIFRIDISKWQTFKINMNAKKLLMWIAWVRTKEYKRDKRLCCLQCVVWKLLFLFKHSVWFVFLWLDTVYKICYTWYFVIGAMTFDIHSKLHFDAVVITNQC